MDTNYIKINENKLDNNHSTHFKIIKMRTNNIEKGGGIIDIF